MIGVNAKESEAGEQYGVKGYYWVVRLVDELANTFLE